MASREFISQSTSEYENQPIYEIREATVEDVVAIRTMHAQSWRDTYVNEEHGVTKEWVYETTEKWLTPEYSEKSVSKLTKVFNDPEHLYRVALRGEEVVGFVHASTKSDGTRHLGALYTDRSTHGTGLGQQLMAIVDEWSQRGTVDLEVAAYNERAKSFYRTHGFVETGVSDESRYLEIPITRMVREGEKND